MKFSGWKKCLGLMSSLLFFSFSAIPLGAQCTADFYADKTEGSPPFTVTFHDKSSPTATSWYWQFPGGSPGTWQGQTPPAVTYSNEGIYTVTLNILCNQTQESRIRTDYIEVKIRYDYGDAPEDQTAYPDLGVTGHFPTCFTGSGIPIRGILFWVTMQTTKWKAMDLTAPVSNRTCMIRTRSAANRKWDYGRLTHLRSKTAASFPFAVTCPGISWDIRVHWRDGETISTSGSTQTGRKALMST